MKGIATALGLGLVAGNVIAAAPGFGALAFEAGQRWSCVTDQGADAYLEISSIEGNSVSFSWGVLNPDTNELDRLCNKRDELSVKEMKEFCRVLGEEFSEGHVLLREGCAAEAGQ